jgi:uncharacterized protein (TIGR04206 family)|nr:DUF3592 domain-containing protein [Kofleriaceae bacterium]
MDVARVIKAVLAGVFAIAAGALVIAGVREGNRLERARGVVVKVEAKPDGDGDALYVPVVTFRVHGSAYTMRGDGSSPALYADGEDVDVMYEPGDPTHAKLDDWVSRWMVALMAGVAAVGCAAAAAIPMTAKRQRHTGYALAIAGFGVLVVSELFAKSEARVMFPLGFAIVAGALAFVFGDRRS